MKLITVLLFLVIQFEIFGCCFCTPNQVYLTTDSLYEHSIVIMSSGLSAQHSSFFNDSTNQFSYVLQSKNDRIRLKQINKQSGYNKYQMAFKLTKRPIFGEQYYFFIETEKDRKYLYEMNDTVQSVIKKLSKRNKLHDSIVKNYRGSKLNKKVVKAEKKAKNTMSYPWMLKRIDYEREKELILKYDSMNYTPYFFESLTHGYRGFSLYQYKNWFAGKHKFSEVKLSKKIELKLDTIIYEIDTVSKRKSEQKYINLFLESVNSLNLKDYSVKYTIKEFSTKKMIRFYGSNHSKYFKIGTLYCPQTLVRFNKNEVYTIEISLINSFSGSTTKLNTIEFTWPYD